MYDIPDEPVHEEGPIYTGGTVHPAEYAGCCGDEWCSGLCEPDDQCTGSIDGE